ncbi:MAG TPA: ABC transporter permease subunit [Vicinamibacterales bacterium]|nr:ABC transporter permease subunit [Vicinamibacterales bacterium]
MTPGLRSGHGARRVFALARKDASELLRNPGAIVPAALMVLGSLFPALLVIVITPRLVGETLEESGSFSEEAANAVAVIPELAGLTGNALTQAFVFYQFSLLLLLVPIVGAMSLATHAVIGEKQSRALEPLLATPISTLELLAAKTLSPFLFALILSWSAAALYVIGAMVFGEPGVWQALTGRRFVIMFGLLGPLVEMATLLVSVMVSSRSNDPRSAQQIASLLILPVTGLFVAQLMGMVMLGVNAMLLGAAGFLLVNGVLLWVGVRLFQRESILTRWK